MNPDDLNIPLDSLERDLIERMDRTTYEAARIMEEVSFHRGGGNYSTYGFSITGRFALALRDAGYLPTRLDEVEVSPARHSDPATSKAAALTLSPTSAYGKLARCLYDRHEYEWRFPRMSSGQHGLTAEQAVALTGIGGKSPWKRCSEIRAARIIEPTGETIAGSSGRQQQLLAITDFGKAEVERLGLDAS